MGAPKQKWTSEEEAALKAGVAKYGAGKWSTILKDPEFSSALVLRSNVDLKDKWRNINVAANGCGSRQKTKLTSLTSQQSLKQDEEPRALSTVIQSDAESLAIVTRSAQNACSKKPIPRLDNLVLETITNLKEPRGSSRVAIATYIKEQYLAPPNLERLLAANLKLLVERGKLIKVKHQYRIAPPPTLLDSRGDSPSVPEGKKQASPKVDTNEIKIFTRSQVDAELEKMRNMTAHEAAAAAAQAVAEAEAAIAEAEAAAREAEKAEGDAEAAQVFAEVALKALKCRTVCF